MSWQLLQARRESAASRTLTDADARKVAIGALVGNATEWYDFFLFNTAAALVFNVQYFVSGIRSSRSRRRSPRSPSAS